MSSSTEDPETGTTKGSGSAAYVVMLDDYLEVYFDQWPVSGTGATLDAARALTQHDGSPTLVPRTSFLAGFEEPKSLINSRTGSTDRGGIYRTR